MHPATKNLSPREREIVTRLAEGEKQTAIAADLEISISAVECYVRRAKAKLQAQTVIHLAVIVTRIRRVSLS
jgi:DNA-binding NarL/FixJ family response regulator